MFLELLHATLKIAILGFALGCLYYSLFAERKPPKSKVEKALSAKFLQMAAIPGFFIVLIISPAIALEGIEVVTTFVHSFVPGPFELYLAGVWIELAILLGWIIEYELQRHTRRLPKLSFQL